MTNNLPCTLLKLLNDVLFGCCTKYHYHTVSGDTGLDLIWYWIRKEISGITDHDQAAERAVRFLLGLCDSDLCESFVSQYNRTETQCHSSMMGTKRARLHKNLSTMH